MLWRIEMMEYYMVIDVYSLNNRSSLFALMKQRTTPAPNGYFMLVFCKFDYKQTKHIQIILLFKARSRFLPHHLQPVIIRLGLSVSLCDKMLTLP